MIYRAELLYQAKSDAQRIFMNLARYDFDKPEFERRMQTQKKTLGKDDETFLKKRLHTIKRLLSQINNFLLMYKIFNDSFIYKGHDIYEYLNAEYAKIKAMVDMYDGVKSK